ncbi:autotransporter outer membrane beta-barrel domain-containing protein [Bibersteinia trehalosi]|nr:autotransporter outer membrane beta-barrel domain-containing protein [Bibersteinia trehalosi]
MKRSLKLTPIAMLLVYAGFSNLASAETCEHTVTEGFLLKDQTVLRNYCTYDLSGTNTEDPEIELRNTNATFNHVTILGDGEKRSKRYWRFGGNIDLFSASENSSVIFNNATLELNTLSNNLNNLLNVDNSTLTLNNSNVTHTSSKHAKILYADNAATVNINDSILKSSITDEESSNFYSNVVQINGLNRSTINISNSTLSSNNDAGFIYLNGSELNVVSSNLSHVKNIASTSSFFTSLVSLINSTMLLKDSQLISEKGDALFSMTNATISVDNSTLSVSNRTNSILFGEGDGQNNITIRNSHLSADTAISSFDGRFNTGLNVQIENSTVNTKAFRKEGFWNNAEENQLIARNSTLIGYIHDRKMAVTLNDSTWKYSSDYSGKVKDLSGANSTVEVDKASYFSTLTIDGNLSGNLHFGLNTDIASQRGDKIVVNGSSSGEHTLTVKDSGNEPKTSGGKVTLVETKDGIANFALKDREFVDAGAYRYFLNKDGTNWVLSNRIEPISEVQPEPEVVITEPEVQPEPEVVITEPEVQPEPEVVITEPEVQPEPEVVITEPEVKPEPEVVITEPEVQPELEVVITEPEVQLEPQIEQPIPETSAEETVSPVVVVTPVVPAIVEIATDNVPTEQPAMKALSEKSNALVSLRQAQGLLISQNLQGVHQRLGELKNEQANSVWVKNINGRHKAKSQAVSADSRSSGFEMDYHNLQIGADRAVSENVRLGGFVGSSRADVDFNGEYGKGKLRSQAVGLYATFANADGWYVDNVVKYERLTSQASEKRKYHAVSLSNEIGKRMIFGQNWTLTPQAQLSYHTIAGKDDEKRLNLFTARTGFRLAKGFEFANGWVVQPYAEVNGIAERSNNAKVRVNQYLFDVPESKGRLQAALGLNAGNGSHRIGIEVVQTYGNQVRQLLAAIVNYRYQW